MKIWHTAGRADGRDLAAARRREGPEKRVQAACRQLLALKGLRPWHLSQARASQQTAGLPDDLVTGWRRPLVLEYKAGRNAQTDEQRDFQQEWEASGGVYWVIRSAVELAERLDAPTGKEDPHGQ